ncbi:MAG: tetratricopeptide repeat protein [Caldimonas sp.]
MLFTDVVDSTQTVERLGDALARQLWTEHDQRARALLIRHRGREVERTDGFFLLFDATSNAARFALEYHAALAAFELQARVGIHVGPVTLRDNPTEAMALGAKPVEVEGLAKPFAARVMALARSGQTLLSASACRALVASTVAGAEIQSHGHYRLKGIEDPVEIFELGLRDRGGFAPPPDTEKSYRVVRSGELWRPVREVSHNLPAERDAFVGRATELHALARRVDEGARLLTVLGPGGTGKTRFVVRYGRVWLGDWPGGVHFCDLSEAKSMDGVLSAVAIGLGVPLGKGDAVVQIGHAIAGRGRCLIVFDNFEQVVEHAASTIGRWLDRAVDSVFIVTSRERMHLPGEEVFGVEPLPLDTEAIELFVVRARAQRPSFALTHSNRAAVAEVVRLLDGLPLAIELAAARVVALSPGQLVERMRDRFGLLAGMRGATARQATLRAAIDWSWDLLTPWEQGALAQCSVFEGGFTLLASEAVLDLTSWPGAPSTVDAIQALVDKSLLRARVGSERHRFDIEEPRFGMYVSIHEYARERLNEQRETQTRHGRFFAGYGTDGAIELLWHHGGIRRRRALELELDNLVAACRRAIVRRDAEVAVAAYRAAWEVLDLRGPFALGIDLGSDVHALVEVADPSLLAAAQVARAMASRRAGRMEEAGIWLENALVLSQQLGDRTLEGMVRLNLGALHSEQGRGLDETQAQLEAALSVLRQVGNRRAEGTTLATLSNLYFQHGRMQESQAHDEAALAIHREVGDRRFEGSVLGNLGMQYFEQGHPDEARAHVMAALEIAREVGDRRSEGIGHGSLALLLASQERIDEAMSHYTQALSIAREVGHRRHEGYVLGNLGQLLGVQRRDDEEAIRLLQGALSIHREVTDQRSEGIVLGYLGDLRAQQGQIGEAREAMASAEALLREVGDALELAKIRCMRGRVEFDAGDHDLAAAALADAERLARETGADSASALYREIASLREMQTRPIGRVVN